MKKLIVLFLFISVSFFSCNDENSAPKDWTFKNDNFDVQGHEALSFDILEKMEALNIAGASVTVIHEGQIV